MELTLISQTMSAIRTSTSLTTLLVTLVNIWLIHGLCQNFPIQKIHLKMFSYLHTWINKAFSRVVTWGDLPLLKCLSLMFNNNENRCIVNVHIIHFNNIHPLHNHACKLVLALLKFRQYGTSHSKPKHVFREPWIFCSDLINPRHH